MHSRRDYPLAVLLRTRKAFRSRQTSQRFTGRPAPGPRLAIRFATGRERHSTQTPLASAVARRAVDDARDASSQRLHFVSPLIGRRETQPVQRFRFLAEARARRTASVLFWVSFTRRFFATSFIPVFSSCELRSMHPYFPLHYSMVCATSRDECLLIDMPWRRLRGRGKPSLPSSTIRSLVKSAPPGTSLPDASSLT